MNNKKILFYAAPFCFGPTSTSLSVSSYLELSGIEVFWIGSGISIDFLKVNGVYKNVIVCDNMDWLSLSSIFKSFNNVVINTDNDLADKCISNGINIIYIDILFWMWPSLPASFYSDNFFYIYEDFYKCKEQENRLHLPCNNYKVGPLLPHICFDNIDSSDTHDILLVNFGGLKRHSSLLCNFFTMYANMIWDIMIEFAEYHNLFTKICCVGGTLASTNRLINKTQVFTGTLNKFDLIKILSECSAIIMSPGLTSYYEAIHFKKPFYFLPPTNYSQFLQLDEYKKRCDPKCYFNLDDLDLNLDIDWYMEEEIALKIIDDKLNILLEKRDVIRDGIFNYLIKDRYSANYDFSKIFSNLLISNGSMEAANIIDSIVNITQT